MQNLSHENEFDLQLSKTDLHVKGFALGLVLKQRQRELGNGLLCLFKMACMAINRPDAGVKLRAIRRHMHLPVCCAG